MPVELFYADARDRGSKGRHSLLTVLKDEISRSKCRETHFFKCFSSCPTDSFLLPCFHTRWTHKELISFPFLRRIPALSNQDPSCMTSLKSLLKEVTCKYNHIGLQCFKYRC